MLEKQLRTLPLWQFEMLSEFKDINHFVSGRRGGVSKGERSSLNLSYKVGDDANNVKENRNKIANAFQIDNDKLIFPEQTHSINVSVTNGTAEVFEETDALVCNTPGVCISVMSADCVPVLFYDPVKKAIGAAHAGWKGTVGKIAVRTVEKMTEVFGSNASDILVGIGPSISPEIYEVRKDVINRVHESFGTKDGLIINENDERGFFDLWEANKRQLIEARVSKDNIEVAGICTFKNSKEFFSARESGYYTGRFAAGIMLI